MLDAHRSSVDRLLVPLAERLRPVSPNVLSVLAFLSAVGAGFAFYFGVLLLAILFLFLNALLDALDGKVAKLTGRESARGDFLDHVLDRYADVIMIGGIALGPHGDVVIGLFALLGVLLASYMGTQAQAVGLGRAYGGVMGRADRLAILFFATWIAVFADPLGRGGGPFVYTPLTLALVIFAVLGQFTAIQRAVSAWRRLGAH
ncbi:MAG TPA: CDP-alcohol phosphatidyltransferase family protein [Thermoplasmata archaeon]|nr:CDP-alcohol phosphatidyltransferase family protein [Thermoplasmata archaeon]